jgi:hypothetical protein
MAALVSRLIVTIGLPEKAEPVQSREAVATATISHLTLVPQPTRLASMVGLLADDPIRNEWLEGMGLPPDNE